MIKRVTQKDVARSLGVSHATVSFVLNNRLDVAIPEDTRARVWQAALDLGYRPNRAAQALVRGRAFTVGVRMPLQPGGEEILNLIWLGAESRSLGVVLTGSGQSLADAEFIWDGTALTLEIYGGKHPFEGAGSLGQKVSNAWQKFDQLAKVD